MRITWYSVAFLYVLLFHIRGDYENVEEELDEIEKKTIEETQLHIEDEDYLEAIAIFKDGIKEMRSVKKELTLHSGRLLHRMGELLTIVNKKEEAIQAMERVVKLYVKLSGPKSEATYNMLLSLADTYMRFEMWETAVPLFEKLAKYEKRKHGKKNERSIWMLTNLGKTYMSAGMPDKDKKKSKPIVKFLKKASSTFKKVIKLLEQTKPDDYSEKKLKIYMRMIRTEMMQGKMENAFDYLEAAQDLAITEYGKESMEYVETLNADANLREMIGLPDEGVKKFEEALTIVSTMFDQDSEEVRKAKKNLEGINRHIGVMAAAKEANVSVEELYNQDIYGEGHHSHNEL